MQWILHKKILVLTLVLFFLFSGLLYFLARQRQAPLTPQPVPVTRIQLSSGCRELVPSHNDFNQKRIDLVFFGFGYSSPTQLKDFAEVAIDFNAQKKGLFSLEPFRSNKQRFNLWYVNEIGKSEADDLWKLSSICRETLGLQNHIFSPQEPLFSERMFTILFMNNESLHPNHFYSSDNSKCEPQKENGRCGLKGLILGIPEGRQYIPKTAEEDFPHLLAHALTFYNINIEYRPNVYYEVLDEHTRFNTPYLPEKDWMNIVKDHSNCFVGTYAQCNSRQNKLFGDMIGNGCGKDGVIDCCTNDESAIRQGALSCKACPECEENKRYDLEISCHEGCWFGSGNYRSTFHSIMSSRIGSQEFGKLNEKILCHQIRLLTGQVSGICNQLQPLFE